MVSPTQQTQRRRHNKEQKQGRKRKQKAAREGTPSFPLDPAAAEQSAAGQSAGKPSR
jgi:hypothetical protein